MKAKLLLASALGLSLLGGAAIAQAQTPPPPPPGGPAAAAPKDDARMAPMDDDDMAEPDDADMAPPPPPGGPREADRREPRGPRHGGPGPRHMMMPPPPSKAANFRIQNGPFRFEVKCSENEPMQACADIALRMLEQAKTLPAPPPPPAR